MKAVTLVQCLGLESYLGVTNGVAYSSKSVWRET
jgi:hypothetical protein